MNDKFIVTKPDQAIELLQLIVAGLEQRVKKLERVLLEGDGALLKGIKELG